MCVLVPSFFLVSVTRDANKFCVCVCVSVCVTRYDHVCCSGIICILSRQKEKERNSKQKSRLKTQQLSFVKMRLIILCPSSS